MPQFTIAEAARAVGVDRATLYRYIKSGKLSLTRDEKGKRGVDAAELSRVFPTVSQNVAPAATGRFSRPADETEPTVLSAWPVDKN